MAESSAGSGDTKALPPEFRAIVALILLDLLAGVWLGLHAKGMLSVYLTPQLPALGVGTLLWGFLPEDPKSAFGKWLAWHLARPAVLWSALSLGVAGLVATLFMSTVVIHSVDPSISTTLSILRGTWKSPDTPSVTILRLNRLTTPQYHQLAIRPTGSSIWVHTPTHMTIRDHLVKPWIPLRLQYPDDFEPMVTVAVLPDDSVLPKLRHRDTRLRVTADDSTVLADTVLADSASLLAFTKPSPPDAEVRARWRAWLLVVNRDTAEFVNPMLERWSGTRWIPTTRPLRLGERLAWEVQASRGALAVGALTLTDAVSDLHLAF